MKSMACSVPASIADTRKRRSLTQRALWVAASMALGLAGGVFLHYLIYRLSLPTEPFIYVSF
jgi:hypothetical protein